MHSIPWVNDPPRTPVILSLGLSLIAHAGLFAVLTQLAQMKQPPQPRPMIYIELVGAPGEMPAGRPDIPATQGTESAARETGPAMAQQSLPPMDKAGKEITKDGKKPVAAPSEPAADTPESAPDLTDSDGKQSPKRLTADLSDTRRKVQIRQDSPDLASAPPHPGQNAAQPPAVSKTPSSNRPRHSRSTPEANPAPGKPVKTERAERSSSSARTHGAAAASRAPEKKPARNSGQAHKVAAEPARFTGHDLNNPAPKYPYTARRLGWEGRVLLRVTVSAQGFAQSVAIISSSGQRILDQAARKAVQRWTFIPATRAGRPVQGLVNVPITFKLN